MRPTFLRLAGLAVAGLFIHTTGFASGLTSSGNTDGLVTWHLGNLPPGSSAREVVFFVFGKSSDEIAKALVQARNDAARWPEPSVAAPAKVGTTVWIKNGVTDFALQGPGHFFWEGRRQSLSCAGGGQLSRFGYYFHYRDATEHRAGTPIHDERALENLRVVEPVHSLSDSEALGWVETSDRQLRIRIRAVMGQGAAVAVEFAVSNAGRQLLGNVRLTAYANIEAAHDHENDYSILDQRTASLLVVDGATGACVAMGGLSKPCSGHSGVWASQTELQMAEGIPFDQWKPFAGIPSEIKKALASAKTPRGIYEEYAPAPPVPPNEPPTRDLSSAEADAVLKQDWTFQAEGKPWASRAEDEIRWARGLASRLAQGRQAPDLRAELAELSALEKRLPELGGLAEAGGAEEFYFAVRRVKRRIVFKNPAVDFSQVLFIDNPYPQGREWQHQVRHRNGMMAVPGGRLLVLDGLGPGGKLRKLAPEKPGSFWRPDLSFDARRVLFCFKAHDDKAFHLYEMNLDGSGLRRLTEGPYDDLDPIYLPDGHILFSTSRGNTFIRCMPYTYSFILARCDADGRNLYLISSSSEPEWVPALLNDGRVIFSRWDYIDKALWRIESLWTIQPDGTSVETFWGNQSVWPDHQAEARPIPHSQRVMFTGLAHHDWFAGSIGIIDPARGHNFPDGLTKVTADVAWPESGNGPVDPVEAVDYHPSGKYDAYKSAFPLSEEDFLVSARRHGKFRLYLMDVHGNRELIYEGAHHIWHALPVKPRMPPPAHPDAVAWPGTGPHRQPAQPGVFFSANVCQGVPELRPGLVKYLRVLQMDHKTYSLWTRDARFSGPAVSALQDDGVKRILGTVPVEADGSVHFKAPAGVVLYFQLLDARYRALQTMRSSCGLMPGERRGCVGCHEKHTTSPLNQSGLALGREPSDLTPPPWGAASVSYERLVQPVLNRYCGECHQGNGKGREKLDLTLRAGQGIFKEPYLTLVGPIGFGVAKQPHTPGLAGALMCENYAFNDPDSYITWRPMKSLSYTSPLVELVMSGQHHDVKLDSVSLQKLIGWVDANCPYRGDEEIHAIPDPQFAGIEKLPVRPRTKTAPTILRP